MKQCASYVRNLRISIVFSKIATDILFLRNYLTFPKSTRKLNAKLQNLELNGRIKKNKKKCYIREPHAS
jgi:hypothetical protein